MEDISAGPSGITSPTCPAADAGSVPEEKAEEAEAAGESAEEAVEGIAEGGGGGCDGEQAGAVGVVTCCVCVEMEQINHCLHSEKICILPILACLVSLALCTAGIKWVFVDKIFEYEPPTHFDPKPIGQDQIIISVDPTLGITFSIPHAAPSAVSLTTTIAISPEVLLEEKSTSRPQAPLPPRVTYPSVTLKYNAERPAPPRQSPRPPATQELSNDIQTVSEYSAHVWMKTPHYMKKGVELRLKKQFFSVKSCRFGCLNTKGTPERRSFASSAAVCRSLQGCSVFPHHLRFCLLSFHIYDLYKPHFSRTETVKNTSFLCRRMLFS